MQDSLQSSSYKQLEQKSFQRTVDGRQSGATYRAVATAFYGAKRVAAEPWKTSSLKAQIARLAAYGRMMIDHGYRQLLRGRNS